MGCRLLNGKQKTKVLGLKRQIGTSPSQVAPRKVKWQDPVHPHSHLNEEVPDRCPGKGRRQGALLGGDSVLFKGGETAEPGGGETEQKCWQHLHFLCDGNFPRGELYTSRCVVFLELLYQIAIDLGAESNRWRPGSEIGITGPNQGSAGCPYRGSR